ncbi:MAG TPA: hypothetical protein VLM89_15560 [Phycisphaerae bacterium]|nr:hypothetical protein [Phycisphaerae bacterium]
MRKNVSGIMAAVVAVVAGASIAFGVPIAGIKPIGVLTPAPGGTVESAVYAISPDGSYAVGYSNGPDLAGSATIQQPVIWSASTGLV